MTKKTKIIKDKKDKGGNVQTYHLLDLSENMECDQDTGVMTAHGLRIFLYKDEVAYLAGYGYVDCFRPELVLSTTQAERDAETGNDCERLYKAFMKKVSQSVMSNDATPIETNNFNGNSGKMCYADVVL